MQRRDAGGGQGDLLFGLAEINLEYQCAVLQTGGGDLIFLRLSLRI